MLVKHRSQWLTVRRTLSLQTSRLARIRQLKAASCSAFTNSKRLADVRQTTTAETDDADHASVDVSFDDLFQTQHHHLLSCLEQTTVCLQPCSRVF